MITIQNCLPYIGYNLWRRGGIGGAMFSIQNRLKLLFVAIVTLVLAISGAYTRYYLGKDLETRRA